MQGGWRVSNVPGEGDASARHPLRELCAHSGPFVPAQGTGWRGTCISEASSDCGWQTLPAGRRPPRPGHPVRALGQGKGPGMELIHPAGPLQGLGSAHLLRGQSDSSGGATLHNWPVNRPHSGAWRGLWAVAVPVILTLLAGRSTPAPRCPEKARTTRGSPHCSVRLLCSVRYFQPHQVGTQPSTSQRLNPDPLV